ncbi:hypothetical protein KO511_12090 [Vibrio hepatarius]|nr:hypothetical protein [Vibrio hepatarius]
MTTLLTKSNVISLLLTSVVLSTSTMAQDANIDSLIQAAQKEGQVYSVGMPDS